FPKAGIPSLISASVTVDDKDPNSYAVSIGFDGMGLPDRDYYLVDSERNLEIRERYKDYLAFVLGKAGYQDAEEPPTRSIVSSIRWRSWSGIAPRCATMTSPITS